MEIDIEKMNDVNKLMDLPNRADINLGDVIMPRKEFKEKIAEIAKEYTEGKLEDPDTAFKTLFKRREEVYKNQKISEANFRKMQQEYVKLLEEIASGSVLRQAELDSIELFIYKKYNDQLTKE